ncbi:MAG: glycoside hydrolase family 130 protein [Mycobacteriales bacterium]
MPLAHRLDAALAPDPSRVIAQPYLAGRERVASVAARLAELPDEAVIAAAARVRADFGQRHDQLDASIEAHAGAALGLLFDGVRLDAVRRCVLGATVTAEYAVEAAALCNPSAMTHPDQSGLAADELRVALSLRCIGEGHLSTLGFASAVIGGRSWRFQQRRRPLIGARATDGSGADTTFPATSDLGQRILLPGDADERNGIEDARFTEMSGAAPRYRATYTAYDGTTIRPRLLETDDLRSFRMGRLRGPGAQNKGMALFPRRIGDLHAALVRVDNESNFVSYSSDGYDWGTPVPVQRPRETWELLQLGNCGPPIETPQGWLVLTHGVGPMRTYCIGAILLDLDDPTRTIGSLREPLLEPAPAEREGYVPNVVYSCGAILHRSTLWIPYGISDSRIGVATVEVAELVSGLRRP